jgi:hypothetical protein
MGAAAAMGAMGAGGAVSAYGAISGGNASNDYYKYLSGISAQNAELAKASGEMETYNLGTQEEQGVKNIWNKERGTVGAQTTALAAGGAGVGSKTAEQLVSNTANMANMDEMALRYNADLKMKNARLGAQNQALNYESQAAGYNAAGSNAQHAAMLSAMGSILGGAGQVSAMGINNSGVSPRGSSYGGY